METIWVLKKDNQPDSEVFATEELGLTAYREHIEERTYGMDWLDDNFEWHDEFYTKGRHYACYLYGEFIASLDQLMVNYGEN